MNPLKPFKGENLLWLRDFLAAIFWFSGFGRRVIAGDSLGCFGGNLEGNLIRIAE